MRNAKLRAVLVQFRSLIIQTFRNPMANFETPKSICAILKAQQLLYIHQRKHVLKVQNPLKLGDDILSQANNT